MSLKFTIDLVKEPGELSPPQGDIGSTLHLLCLRLRERENVSNVLVSKLLGRPQGKVYPRLPVPSRRGGAGQAPQAGQEDLPGAQATAHHSVQVQE